MKSWSSNLKIFSKKLSWILKSSGEVFLVRAHELCWALLFFSTTFVKQSTFSLSPTHIIDKTNTIHVQCSTHKNVFRIFSKIFPQNVFQLYGILNIFVIFTLKIFQFVTYWILSGGLFQVPEGHNLAGKGCDQAAKGCCQAVRFHLMLMLLPLSQRFFHSIPSTD